jgi:hypothetical protein
MSGALCTSETIMYKAYVDDAQGNRKELGSVEDEGAYKLFSEIDWE